MYMNSSQCDLSYIVSSINYKALKSIRYFENKHMLFPKAIWKHVSKFKRTVKYTSENERRFITKT